MFIYCYHLCLWTINILLFMYTLKDKSTGDIIYIKVGRTNVITNKCDLYGNRVVQSLLSHVFSLCLNTVDFWFLETLWGNSVFVTFHC